jgi:hypothetical protein
MYAHINAKVYSGLVYKSDKGRTEDGVCRVYCVAGDAKMHMNKEQVGERGAILGLGVGYHSNAPLL